MLTGAHWGSFIEKAIVAAGRLHCARVCTMCSSDVLVRCARAWTSWYPHSMQKSDMGADGATLGVIGGSGLYAMDGLSDLEELVVDTPFGAPSDVVMRGRMNGATLLFLPRHGRGHRIPPHRVNYRANVLALKQLGAQQILSVSAVGSLREEIHPGDLVLVDQFIDRTCARPRTFFDAEGAVAHVSLADPVDAALWSALQEASRQAGVSVHAGGTYVCIEGPQFSTRAESHLFRAWGAHVIGMTNLPEARLAREAQLPYATLAIATDYDCWRPEEEAVTVDVVIATLKQGLSSAQKVLGALTTMLPDPAQSPHVRSLAAAVMSDRGQMSAQLREKLRDILG